MSSGESGASERSQDMSYRFVENRMSTLRRGNLSIGNVGTFWSIQIRQCNKLVNQSWWLVDEAGFSSFDYPDELAVVKQRKVHYLHAEERDGSEQIDGWLEIHEFLLGRGREVVAVHRQINSQRIVQLVQQFDKLFFLSFYPRKVLIQVRYKPWCNVKLKCKTLARNWGGWRGNELNWINNILDSTMYHPTTDPASFSLLPLGCI